MVWGQRELSGLQGIPRQLPPSCSGALLSDLEPVVKAGRRCRKVLVLCLLAG